MTRGGGGNVIRCLLEGMSPQLFVSSQVKDIFGYIKPSLWLLVILTQCCWCCAHRTEMASANHVSGRARRRGERQSAANGPWGLITFFVRRTATLRTGSLASDWAIQTTHIQLKAHCNFHLTVIHEILQAYLQVLRRLLLNLLCQRLSWLRRLLKFSIS